jgi:hypothetical protein
MPDVLAKLQFGLANEGLRRRQMLDYIWIAAAVVVLVLVFRLARNAQKLRVGGLYSVIAGPREFGVVKVLAFDKAGVHVRLYKNRFNRRPKRKNLPELRLGRIDEDGLPGIGHLPIVKKIFYKWQPLFILQQEVTDEELEGYRAWKEESAKYWGSEGLEGVRRSIDEAG